MALKLGKNSKMYKYGSTTNINYIFTNDNMFGLEVINSSLDSYYLYVNINATIDPSSPLGKFIADGFIIKVGKNDDIRNRQKKNNSIELEELDNPIILQYQKEPGIFKDIEGGFYKYRFHRPLLDLRYNEKGQQIPENEDALNENDCLNFGECSTAKYIGIEKHNITVFPYKYETSVLESKETGVPFGISDELNMEMLKYIPTNKKNNYALPKQGECYAIARKEYRESVMYHIAFCIYSHNGVNITLEANADNGREYLPAFGFYDRSPTGFTFHKRYISMFDNGETIVLKGRNINDILKEINEEVLQQVAVGGRKITNKKRIKSKRQKMHSYSNKINTQRISKKTRKLSSIRTVKVNYKL